MINKIILSILLSTSLYSASTPNADLAIKETYVNSGDAKLFCRVTGEGKPLIVIHGGPGLTQDYLLPGMYELAKNNLTIFYDQWGCGRSSGEINKDTITIKAAVEDIEAIRHSMGFEKISLLGHSWGGFIAMNYAITHPEHVDKLIISNSFPSTSKDWALCHKEYAKRMAPFQEEINKITNSSEFSEGNSKTVEEFYRLIFRQYCYNPDKANLLNLWMTTPAILNGNKVYKYFGENLMDTEFDITNAINKLKVQTLVITGDADLILPITSRHIHESIPGSKYLQMQNCGHFPYVEDPATYFRHIQEFLNPNESGQ